MFLFYLICYAFVNELISTSFGKPLEISASSYKRPNFLLPHKEDKHGQESKIKCYTIQLGVNDVRILQNSEVFIKVLNVTIPAATSPIADGSLRICYHSEDDLQKPSFKNCEKWRYKEDKYIMLSNGSVLLNKTVLEKGTYQVNDNQLIRCASDENYTTGNLSESGHLPLGPSVQDEFYTCIANLGGGISIVALIVNLFMFLMVPSLRNLQGYNLASLSVAFLFGYSFMLIGQIPEVSGIFCVISGALQLYFFIAAFFCMNVIALDIWKTLKLATQKISSTIVKRRQFVWYSLYAWGCPLIITITCIISDNIENVPDEIKPYFGRGYECWITNKSAKTIFFVAPAFTLLVMNGIFFILSAFMIRNNTAKSNNDQHMQNAKQTFFLYLRLGTMMGVTWLIGVIATAAGSRILLLIYAVPNSLQGLFVCLLLTCSDKVLKHPQDANSTANSKGT